ncbi:hypothetical protein METHB2_670014 [Candidatus Methylobacter favarea]|uniref:Uncharacterized protein n=1 Tax=Candidatus Methylobacter favarea TaxID=2707345 RepID=A0A8S0WL29_9GAMM|nr:hypothetical protein [Candidatus Methylobacter favarea]CAA9892360.1 hypothetical protein METHB2_670014 [Candidatus Methylobacter favarea]
MRKSSINFLYLPLVLFGLIWVINFEWGDSQPKTKSMPLKLEKKHMGSVRDKKKDQEHITTSANMNPNNAPLPMESSPETSAWIVNNQPEAEDLVKQLSKSGIDSNLSSDMAQAIVEANLEHDDIVIDSNTPVPDEPASENNLESEAELLPINQDDLVQDLLGAGVTNEQANQLADDILEINSSP